MAFCNPLRLNSAHGRAVSSHIRLAGFLFGFFGSLALLVGPASAQEIRLLRDTETERLLKSYEDPLAKADGLDPGHPLFHAF